MGVELICEYMNLLISPFVPSSMVKNSYDNKLPGLRDFRSQDSPPCTWGTEGRGEFSAEAGPARVNRRSWTQLVRHSWHRRACVKHGNTLVTKIFLNDPNPSRLCDSYGIRKKTLCMVFPNYCLTRENKDVNIDYYIPIIGKKRLIYYHNFSLFLRSSTWTFGSVLGLFFIWLTLW